MVYDIIGFKDQSTINNTFNSPWSKPHASIDFKKKTKKTTHVP